MSVPPAPKVRADEVFLDAFLSGLAWWRRLRGGHWERWYVDHPVCANVWHRLDGCTRERPDTFGNRPTPLCRGTPTCERR